MAHRFTARGVEAVQPGPTRQEIPDPHLPGLYLVVQPTGAKSWAVRYRYAGAPRKHTLGQYPAIDLKSARELASAAFRAVADGRDPAEEKRERRERTPSGTVASLAEEFIARYVRRRNKKRTAEETERLLRLHVLPRWGKRSVDSITRRDVLNLLEDIVDAGTPIAANRTKTAISTMFTWAVDRDMLAASPCNGVKDPSPETERDRVLSDTELCHVWKAADKFGGPFGTLVKLLILTCQRRSEVAEMPWSEIDDDLWIIAKERTKNGLQHSVPLSRASLALLERLPRNSAFVLTTNGAAPASNFGKNKRKLDALLPKNMPPWTLHDLRRSGATGMAKLGVNLPVIEKVLNHVSGSFAGIVGVYQHHDFADEKRAALEAWGRHIEALVSGKPAKVLPLRKA